MGRDMLDRSVATSLTNRHLSRFCSGVPVFRVLGADSSGRGNTILDFGGIA